MRTRKPLRWAHWIVGALASMAIGAVLLVGFFSWLIGFLFGDPSKDEVARVVSMTGKVDAVLLETNGGATTSFGYEVYVVDHGDQPSGTPAVWLYGAVRNQSAYGANLKWVSPDTVTVEFMSAESAKINRRTESIGAQTIYFVVREGVTDESAPPGGMLYNLRGRQ